MFPSLAGDPEARRVAARIEQYSASPAGAAELTRLNAAIDVRHVLAAIRVPTIIVHHTDDPFVEVGHGRYLAEHIPGARYVELPGTDHARVRDGDPDPVDDVEEFLTGVRHHVAADRVLATVLFTDIAGSTERAAALGDREWRDLLARHHRVVREALVRHRGREIGTDGDGFFVTFDGPARAIRCGQEITGRVQGLGLQVRAGVHTGEVEVIGDDLGGIAVHIGARVAALARPGEVFASRTVVDLVAGSGIFFQDRGEHELKGVGGTWQLFAVER